MPEMPFTIEEFLGVFVSYNTAIWPVQVLAYIMGITAVFSLFFRYRHSETLILWVMALFWIWNGVVYHIIHFSKINPAATVFGIFFIIQGVLFLYAGTFDSAVRFRISKGFDNISGMIFILYAMVVYPLLGMVFGHVYPGSPVFGVAPCPTTIFTFGMLLMTAGKVPYYLLAIPFIWSLIGMSAAVNLHVWEDYGLVVAGVAGTVTLLFRNRRVKRETEA